jgi:transcriptional regulator with XRE-family HTH domain
VTGRPGRTQRIPVDETPLNAPRPDINARIGWLLLMSRLHHVDEVFHDGHRFAHALSESGARVSRSLVSRWESGKISVSYEGMTAYESVLGLEAGQVSSITGYVKASLPGVTARASQPKLDATSPAYAERLDELIDAAEAGAESPRDWQELGWHVASAPMLHLRRGTWETLAHRLVNLQPRAVRVAYRQLSTAAMSFATLSRAQSFLVEAIEEYISDPAVQVVTSPTGLLDRLPTREAARLVLDLIDHPRSRPLYLSAVWTATQKLARGDFTGEERNQLGVLVLKAWRRDPIRAGQDLAELIGGLPEGLRSTLVQASDRAGRRRLGYVVEHGEELLAARARVFAEEVAARARSRTAVPATYDDDQMLPRLIREALFHRDSERRHLAALVISASPFATPVTDELLASLSEPHPDWIRGRLATLARYLSVDMHRMRLVDLLEDEADEVAMPAAHAIGHLRLNVVSDQALRNSLGRDWSNREQAKMYALGMSGSPVLGLLAASKNAPQWQCSAADWWIRNGAAVR